MMARTHVWTEARRRRRGDALGVLIALLIGGLIAWTVITVQGLAHDLEESNRARDALAQQVKDLGGTPVVKPGEPGVRGRQGPRGEPGPTGPSGQNGKDGKDGKPGPTPKPGEDGTDGKDGRPGPDSTVPGPAGPTGATGEQGPQGPPGPAGADGKDGRDGTDGRDGQTCPDGYSLQPPPDDPDALVCRRDGAPAPPQDSSPSAPAVLAPDRRRS